MNPGRLRRIRTLAPAVACFMLALAISDCPARGATSGVTFGAVGDVAGLSHASGAPLAENRYVKLNANVPATRMINVMPIADWATVAAAKPGSTTYADLVRWGDTLKSRGPVWLAFSHEPEAKASSSRGTASQFIAAFRNVVKVIRSRRATNVSFTWQMTAWAFEVAPSDPRYATKWYPGDSYVDTVSADAFNWYTCGTGKTQWLQLSAIAGPALSFATSHHKELVLGEYASQSGSRRAQWLRNAAAWAKTNSATLRAIFYFQHADTVANRPCFWMLTSAADIAAFGQTAR